MSAGGAEVAQEASTNWVPIVQASIAGAVFLWGLPVAWQHWSWERRLAARVERNTKVIAATTNAEEKRVLEDDNEELALSAAAVKRLPWPRGFWVTYLLSWIAGLTQVYPLIVGGSSWRSLTVLAVGVALIAWTSHQWWTVRRLRREWIALQRTAALVVNTAATVAPDPSEDAALSEQ